MAMKFTTRSRYGTRLLMDIALHEAEGPVSLRDIAQRLEVSQKYLEKLSRILREAGYIESMVGALGGYSLKVHLTAICMGDVIFLLEAGEPRARPSQDNPLAVCERRETCITRNIWNRAINAMRDTLNAISLEDMLRDACSCPTGGCEAAFVSLPVPGRRAGTT
jgi:Rrf2 family protein